jgi:hypothetical protein
MLKYDPNISWQDFAAKTIVTDDLDPVYVALYRANMPEDMLMRWCAAFVTYYHMGTASQICHLQGDDFWTELWTRYDTAPRASERRHFRGEAGKKAIKAWINTYGTPEKFFAACMQPSFMKLLQKSIPQIGHYFTWKCMDLREAVFGYDVDWSESEYHMVTLPMQGLDVIFPELENQRGVNYANALLKVADAISHINAPPRFTRPCGVAEAETVCCMAKAYYKNQKPIGKDIVEKRTDLVGYGEIADHILSFMPEEPFDVSYLSYSST